MPRRHAASLSAAPQANAQRTTVQRAAAPQADAPQNNPPSYWGHRQRLRERFARAGADGLQEYELLELVLFRALPRQDVKPLAKNLLARFGNLSAVFSAPREQLREFKGVTDNLITDFHLVQAVAEKIGQSRVKQQTVIASWRALKDYCRTRLAEKQTEEFHVLFLDSKHRLIEDKLMSTGTVNHTQVYPREVIKRALMLNATGLIIVHNHPGGDPAPSQADISLTNELKAALVSLGLVLHDHLIIGRDGEASFKNLGLL